MAKKKKKRSNTPRVKRMNQKGRLQSAVGWLEKYTGKNYIRGYRKHFGVNVGMAIAELKILGVPLSDEMIQRAKQSAEALVKAKQRRKEERKRRLQNQEEEMYPDSDETYAYIVGYTGWGFPYGVTWEEMERFADQDSLDATLPPRIKERSISSADDNSRPYAEKRDEIEVPFDLEAFMRCYEDV